VVGGLVSVLTFSRETGESDGEFMTVAPDSTTGRSLVVSAPRILRRD